MQVQLQKIFSKDHIIKKCVGLVMVILTIFIGYNYVVHLSLQNSLKVQLISGAGSIITPTGGQTILSQDESHLFKKNDTLSTEDNSIALVIFNNGKIQTFSGSINLVFEDAVKEDNAIKYSFQNKASGEKLFYTQNYGLTESTATVLGFLSNSNNNNSKNKIGNVLGASETSALSDSEKQEKFNKLHQCLDLSKDKQDFNYSKQLSTCLTELGLKNLNQLK